MKKISSCPVCSRRCAMELTVENGEPVSLRPKVSEGFEGCSQLCSKGVRAIDYRNRPDRVLSPLRRVGERGEGRFEAISWDEAIEEISRRLLDIRSAHGADAVSFFTGYTKWYRPVFRRFAAFFGSKNYATESSSCQRSCVMANICDTGFQSAPDYKNTGVILATARRRFPPPLKAAVERGAKLILWTCREGKELEEAVEACRAEGLLFDVVNDNLPEMKAEWGNNPRKVAADEYWDDRALYFERVEPIRCGECRYYDKRSAPGGLGWCSRPGIGCGHTEDFWCAGAERKEEEDGCQRSGD